VYNNFVWFIHPVLNGGQVTESRICWRGLHYDRAWMIINAASQCISQKRLHRMCVIVPKIDELNQRMILTSSGFPDLPLPLEPTLEDTTRASICTSRVCADRFVGFCLNVPPAICAV